MYAEDDEQLSELVFESISIVEVVNNRICALEIAIINQ